jgi:hypothetical protein
VSGLAAGRGRVGRRAPPGDDFMIFKIFSPKNLATKLAF